MHDPDVAHLLDTWLEHGRHHWSPSTITTHRSIVRRLTAALGDEPITALGTARIERYYGELATELAPATIHRVHSVLLSALSLAVRWEWIDRNPAVRAARRPRAHRSHTIDPDGLARVVVGTHDLRHGVATALLKGGVHPAIVSAVLGHAKVAFTLDVYSHVDVGMTAAAADELDRALGG